MAVWRLFARYASSSNEAADKSKRLLELLNVDSRRLRENRDVVIYRRNRVCPDCKKEIRIAEPEFLHDTCPHAWRYFHGFSQKCPCPLIGVMRFTRFAKLRLEQRVRLEAQSKESADDKQ